MESCFYCRLVRVAPRPPQKRVGRAFTLLELLVVLTLVALLAATAAPRLGGAYDKSRLDTAITQLETVDRQVRTIAQKRNQSAELRFDLTRHRITATWDDDESDVVTRLPPSIQIDSLISRREKKSSGQAAVRVYPDGSTESYAVRLVGSNKNHCWLFVAGLSGQISKLDSRHQAEEILHAVR